MLKKSLLLFTALLSFQLAQAQLNGLIKKAENVVKGGGDLSQDEAGNGLKEALNAGIG